MANLACSVGIGASLVCLRPFRKLLLQRKATNTASGSQDFVRSSGGRDANDIACASPARSDRLLCPGFTPSRLGRLTPSDPRGGGSCRRTIQTDSNRRVAGCRRRARAGPIQVRQGSPQGIGAPAEARPVKLGIRSNGSSGRSVDPSTASARLRNRQIHGLPACIAVAFDGSFP